MKSGTVMGVVDESIVRRYIQYLRLERSYSKNTLDAYRRDLQKLLVYYADNNIDFRNVTLEVLDQFAGELRESGIQARSVARVLSGVRSFYRFLTLEKEVNADPTELLESPRIGKHLPDVLSVEEIDSIISVIDLSKPEGIRDRAIIEVLYGCGLRISELCNLKISQLYLEDGYIRVKGKGGKAHRGGLRVCLTHPWMQAEQDKSVCIYKRLCPEGRHQQEYQPPHLPPQFCHPLAGGRGQSACHTDDAWARRHLHHRNLHAYRQNSLKAGNIGASSKKYSI